jgi:HEAT repeat protein
LGCIGPQAKDAIPELIRLLTVGEDVTWGLALGAIGPAAVPKLLEIIHGGQVNIQYNALAALGSVLDNLNGQSTGMDVSAIVPVLIARLNDLDASVRRLSALLLGLCGTKARAALPDLLRVSKDQDKEVSRAAMIALHQIGYSKTMMLPAATKSLFEPK